MKARRKNCLYHWLLKEKIDRNLYWNIWVVYKRNQNALKASKTISKLNQYNYKVCMLYIYMYIQNADIHCIPRNKMHLKAWKTSKIISKFILIFVNSLHYSVSSLFKMWSVVDWCNLALLIPKFFQTTRTSLLISRSISSLRLKFATWIFTYWTFNLEFVNNDK